MLSVTTRIRRATRSQALPGWATSIPTATSRGYRPDAQRAPRLLFVSDVSTNDVYIFTMPDMNLKGTLTGFNQPQGECSDTHGNIYIANTRASTVLEYSRTGTLLNTYADYSAIRLDAPSIRSTATLPLRTSLACAVTGKF